MNAILCTLCPLFFFLCVCVFFLKFYFTNLYIRQCFSANFKYLQRLIFTEPDEGVRKVVLATNIAETSITINDVVYVLDCGKAKETSYDALNNTPCLLPSWISKVSAQQVRLYSLAKDMDYFPWMISTYVELYGMRSPFYFWFECFSMRN